MISLSVSPSLLLLDYLPSEEEKGHAVYIFLFSFQENGAEYHSIKFKIRKENICNY